MYTEWCFKQMIHMFRNLQHKQS